MKPRVKPNTVLTTKELIQIADQAINVAGGVTAVATKLQKSRVAIHQALTGQPRYHSLLIRICREIAGLQIECEVETIYRWTVSEAPPK